MMSDPVTLFELIGQLGTRTLREPDPPDGFTERSLLALKA